MGLLSDRQIRALVQNQRMIEPFVDHQVRGGVISYGLSSYGYDMRLADEFRIFTPNPYNTVVDPKNLDDRALIAFQGEVCIIPPNSYALGRSIEYFRIPSDVMAICTGKSTYARAGLNVNITPLEAGWNGFLTIELANGTPLPLKVFANEGIAQLLFLKGDEPCEVSYADRAGKYQNQTGITLPKL